MKKFFSLRTTSIIHGAILIAFFSLISRLLGIVRARVFAQNFGTSQELDIFYLSFRIPDLIFSILMLGGASSVLIPILSELIYKKSVTKEKINKIVSNSINFILIFIIFFIAIIIITLPFSVNLIAPGLDSSGKEKVLKLTILMLIQPIFLILSDIFSSTLQVYKIFISYSLGPALYNIGIIIGAVFFYKIFGLYGLGLGVVLGAFFHMIIHTFFFKKIEFRYIPTLDLKDKYLKHIIKLSLPRAFGLFLFQLNFLIINSLSSKFGEGYVSSLNYALDIEYVPYGVVGIAFATSSFAYLSEISSKKEFKKFFQELHNSLVQALFFVLPIIFLFYVLREEIVKVLLFIGRFKEEDVKIVSKFIAITIFAVPFQALIPIFTKSFYALKKTFIPILINGVSVITIIIFSYFLAFKYKMGFWGIGYAILISGLVNSILFFMLLKINFKEFFIKRFIKEIGIILIPNVLLALSVYISNNYLKEILKEDIFMIFLRGAIAGGFGIFIYIIISYFLNIKLARFIINKVIRR